MGVVQLRQIRNHLETGYVPYVDISDCKTRSPEDQTNISLTRALAAFAIVIKADASKEIATTSIIDGFNDCGIDAIYYSGVDRVLYFIQAKWSNDGSGSINQASAEKFIRGVKYILNLNLEPFNQKVKSRQVELEGAVNNTLRISLATIHSGSERIGEHAARVMEEFLSELNDTGEVAFLENLTQEQLYSVVSQGGRGDPVNISVQLFDWGQTKNPYTAFYGQVAASDVADWGLKYRQRIFSKNIRAFLGASTAVNEGITESVRKAPHHFWYLNNGITALCGTIRKRPIGGASHDAGTFDCQDVAVVNGAQTVGVLSELGSSLPAQLEQARVPIRLISLEGCPPELAMEVTRATNTQNRVDSRNFVALDPEQTRLRAELLVDGVDYEYRQSEGEPVGVNRFGVIEATVALACAQRQADLAIQAKREISRLWEDLGRPPYKTMFNSALPGLRLWHLVQMLRVIDRVLVERRVNTTFPQSKSLVIHANRLIAHIVMRDADLSKAGGADFDVAAAGRFVGQLTDKAIVAVTQIVDRDFGGSYLASLFKNVSKCKAIAGEVQLPSSARTKANPVSSRRTRSR